MKYLLLINAIVHFVKTQKVTEDQKCDNNRIYNPTVYYCDACPEVNNIKLSPNITGCIPPLEYKYSFDNNYYAECNTTAAKPVKAATEDRLECLQYNNTNYNQTSNSCETDFVRVDKDQLGQYLGKINCTSIPNTPQNNPIFPKDLCPENQEYKNNKCQCIATYRLCGKECILDSDYNDSGLGKYTKENAKDFNYQFVESDTKTDEDSMTNSISSGSDLIEELFELALFRCKNDFKQDYCQTLANLCVLHMYNPAKSPCSFLVNERLYTTDLEIGKSDNAPWLYYRLENKNQFNPSTYLKDPTKIPFDVSFDAENRSAMKVHRFELFLAKWDIEGKYYGMNPIASEFILCTNTYQDTIDFRSFGSTLTNECHINLVPYLNRTYTTYFYEMYLRNPIDGSFIDIPVLIDGIMNAQGANSINSQASMENWILTRRFFIMDNLSGLNLELSYRNNIAGTSIRFAKNITLNVEMQTGTPGESKIYLPYIYIRYVAKLSEIVTQKTFSLVNFSTEYFMDVTNFQKSAMIIFIIMNILVSIVVIARMYVWTKLNPSKLSPDNYSLWFLGICLSKLFKYWGLFMFFYVWGVSCYWYIFFKMQYRPYVLLPKFQLYFEVYRDFDIIFGIAAAVFGLHMFHRIYEQTNYDIFFIDWEHDKDILINNMGEEFRTDKYRGAWRGIHIANQFNQLQKQRTISMSFTFLWLIMLWYYQNTNWMNYANAVPTVSYAEKSPNNYILQFFLSTFILFVAGITQFIVVRLLQLWLPLKKTEFLDLCCVANISLFILDQSLHGYYVHGQSPLGKSDTSLDELVKFLEEEGKGKIRGRGVTEDQGDNLQSYEIFLSYNMRTIYDGLYYLQTQSIIDQASNADKLHNQSRLTSILQYIPKSLNVKSVYLLNNYMNGQLKGKIEAVSSQSKIFIKEKTFLERFLDFPPSIDLTSSEAKEIVLYKDPNSNFDNVLFSGMEFDWLIFVIFWFQMWSIALRGYGRSFPLAIFLTFICERILFKCRIFFGEKNVAKKAVIDNRFFS